MLEACPDGNGDFDLADALPGSTPEERHRALQDLKKWLKSLPLSRRPLCKVIRIWTRSLHAITGCW